MNEAGHPFCNGRDTLLARPSFLHINPLAGPAGSTRSENARALLSALGSDKRVNFFSNRNAR